MAEVVKEFIYFCRDETNRPIITVMLLIDEENNIARGYAVCSDLETPVTKETAKMRNGPGIARKRAKKAFKAMGDMFPIEREESFRIMLRVPGGEALHNISKGFKATFIRPCDARRRLTPYEQKILKINGVK